MKTLTSTLLLLVLTLSASGQTSSQAESNVPTLQFEYLRIYEGLRWYSSTGANSPSEHYVEHSDGSTAKITSVIKALNEAGTQGWEAVGVHSEDGSGWRNNVYLLKRIRR